MSTTDKILVDKHIGYSHRVFVVTLNGNAIGPNEPENLANERIADMQHTVRILRGSGMSDDAIASHLRLVRVVHLAKGGW